MNRLYYGDNIKMLDRIADDSVDLIYLDPPFNSNRSYNVLFKDESGEESDAQITAFEDSWHWSTKTRKTWTELVEKGETKISAAMNALHILIGRNQMMAYLVMMTERLVKMRQKLKPTGSIYLHCDQTASHYLKVVMDAVFGARYFRNEIIWERENRAKGSQYAARKFGVNTDTILFYTKSNKYPFHAQMRPLSDDEIREKFKHEDERGKYFTGVPIFRSRSMGARPNLCYEYKGTRNPYPSGWRVSKEKLIELDNTGRIGWRENGTPYRKTYLQDYKGFPYGNLWTDIPRLTANHEDYSGYQTQKPRPLLERIILASTNPGDLVLDPFCGCGTAIIAAEKLKRRWIGIDITHLSVAYMKYRLRENFGLVSELDYEVDGEPEDIGGAHELAERDRYQFQFWALSKLDARPINGKGKKGADRGIDGEIRFIEALDGGKLQLRQILVQVKSGKNVSVRDIRDLVGTIEREKAAIGVFLTLAEPTKPMIDEADDAGDWASKEWGEFPRIQILTIQQLLDGERIKTPPSKSSYPKFQRITENEKEQHSLI